MFKVLEILHAMDHKPQLLKLTLILPPIQVQGKVSKNISTQGQCASGYAFATIGAVQSSYFKIFKNFTSMSAQHLVDCTKQTGNDGCTKGNSINSLHYLMNRGAMKESDYPYTGKTQNCSYNAAKKVWQVDNCTKLNSNTVLSLQTAIFQQPIIVQFDASDKNFLQLSGDGLYQNAEKTCGNNINHYMLAVGWGQIDRKVGLVTYNYYYILVKNSLGPGWGDKGYARIVYKSHKPPKSESSNEGCGIFKEAYFPY